MFLATVDPGVMKVLLLDCGFINGTQIGRLKREHGIDTVIPIRSDMDLQEDVRGLMTLPTAWEEYEPTHRLPLPDVTAASHGQPSHPTAKKRESKRQETLARKQEKRAEPSREPSRIRERTLIARFPGLTSWWDCPVPLTGVYSRDIYADGHEEGSPPRLIESSPAVARCRCRLRHPRRWHRRPSRRCRCQRPWRPRRRGRTGPLRRNCSQIIQLLDPSAFPP